VTSPARGRARARSQTRARRATDPSPYPSIGDYAMIGDCHTAALVSTDGSIDWCCMPRFDGGAGFARLLDWEHGGHCQICPAEEHTTAREYVDGTLVLATTFRAPGGEARLYDCFAMREGGAQHPYRQVLRVVEGIRGTVSFNLLVQPRFDYGAVKPWIRLHSPNVYSAVGGNDALVISGDPELSVSERHDLVSSFRVAAQQRVRVSLMYFAPELIDPDPPPAPRPADIDARLHETLTWWRTWLGKVTIDGPYAPEARRSALVLKALVHAPTGAVVAAPTTSLPESIGHGRNWDYRYSWVRDSQFTVRSLTELGLDDEADGFRRFIERSAAGSAESLQIMYGVGGERRLLEQELALDGYAHSQPVRIGNAASQQEQNDVYGYLLDLAWRWHERGRSPDDDYWRFLLGLVDTAIKRWKDPDCGIWEMRGNAQHFVHSKVMCWAAVDKGIRLAEESLRQAPLDEWRAAVAEMRTTIERDGYDDERGVFVQSFDNTEMDAALLLLPQFDFVAYDDERMVRTTDAVRAELDDGGLLRRYRSKDKLPGHEGAFLACSFWLVECLVRQGRDDDARDVFARAVACGNDVGLFSEEFINSPRAFLGNFPQGLTHLSHVTAITALRAHSL
jgi:GH15 family glucan-1,4-alpha-glucosidase